MSDSEDTDASCAEWPVTKEWLESLLSVHHGEGSRVVVEDFDVSPGCTAGESVLSDILAVTVDYSTKPDDTRRELNVIVKLLPQDAFSRFFVTEAQFDLREIKFYTQVSFVILYLDNHALTRLSFFFSPFQSSSPKADKKCILR